MKLQVPLFIFLVLFSLGCSLYTDLEPIEGGTVIPDLGEPDLTDQGMDLSDGGMDLSDGGMDLSDGGMDLSDGMDLLEYTVTFDAQGGSPADPASKSVIFDEAYGVLATTTRTGYAFAGWWTASTGGTEVLDTTTVRNAADHALYARWTANTYTVTLKYEDGVTPDSTISVTYDAPYGTLPEPTRTGYSLVGWWMAAGGTGSQVEPTTQVVITGDHDLYAYWGAALNAADACTEDAQCVSNECQRGYCKLLGFSVIPSGTFTQGSPLDEPARRLEETQRIVTLNRAFYMQETEVTQDEWMALMNNNPSPVTMEPAGNQPVTNVSWWDAIAYMNTLSLDEGLQQCYVVTGCTGAPGVLGYSCASITFEGLDCAGYRLPTEAEWEYAARAGTTTMTYAGNFQPMGCETANPLLSDIAWWCGNALSPQNVGGKTANVWGLYDMIGNVWEWNWDWYAAYFAGDVADPVGPATGSERVYRGCSPDREPDLCRAAFRTKVTPTFRNEIVGFRPARSIP